MSHYYHLIAMAALVLLGMPTSAKGQPGRFRTEDREPLEVPFAVPWTESGPPSVAERYVAHRENPLRSTYLFSGEFYVEKEDLRLPGVGIDVIWARKYRSKSDRVSTMGHGWTHSYDIRVSRAGPNLLLEDGTGRQDVFFRQPDQSYTRREHMIRGEEDGSQVVTFTFPDGSSWRFFPLDGSPHEGMIEALIERHGNTITFAYDGNGRLTTITDTLGHTTTVNYNADGFVDTVQDFSGRTVTYTYWQNGDAEGSDGDLASVTTPPVTYYPLGKTTTYHYTVGHGDSRLNHNLVEIVSPRLDVVLRNIYASSTDENDLEFDRLVTQEWGDDGAELDVHYALIQSPGSPADDPKTLLRAIVNDRVGNVSEHDYDRRNRLKTRREFTGRAPLIDQPTTETDNRPGPPLRGTDPASFLTVFHWDSDSLLQRIRYPRGGFARLDYQGGADPLARGNLTTVTRSPGPTPAVQTQIVEAYTYGPRNLLTSHTDPRGHATVWTRNALGDVTHIDHRAPSVEEDFEYDSLGRLTAYIHPDNGSSYRRRDEYAYYVGGPQVGHLERETLDVATESLTTLYEYDDIGQVTRIVEPSGDSTLFDINDLGQVTRIRSAQVTLGATTHRYVRRFFYDEGDQLARIDVQRVDDQGTVPPDEFLTTILEYDALDRLTRRCRESGTFVVPTGSDPKIDCDGLPGLHFATESYAYDANGNVTRERFGRFHEGEPENRIDSLYDERDLLFKATRAPTTAVASTTSYAYDANGNLTRVREGLEAPSPRVWMFAHDGYDRLIRETDPMKNVSLLTLDPNGNEVTRMLEGELNDVAGDTDNIRLRESRFAYDEMNRLTRTEEDHFDPDTELVIGDGLRVTTQTWSAHSEPVQAQDDLGSIVIRAYDTMGRLGTHTDPRGNSVAYAYDVMGNLTRITETDLSDLGAPAETYITNYAYDEVGRLTGITDPIGNVQSLAYDSRNNILEWIDANSTENRFRYDGLSREIERVRDLDGDGADAGDAQDLVVQSAWDDSSRLTSRTDGKGNTTTYEYDAADNRTLVSHPTCSTTTFAYDVHGDMTRTVDPNLTEIEVTYDGLSRPISNTITVGPGVANTTTFETFEYDGDSNRKSAQDDTTTLDFVYDSLGSLTSETLDGTVTTSIIDSLGQRLQASYPGGATVSWLYDSLERPRQVTAPDTSVASLLYRGPRRIEQIDHVNGTRSEFAYNGIANPPGDDGDRQLSHALHTFPGSGTILEDRTFVFDPAQNKIQDDDIRVGGSEITIDYLYDAISRLTRSDRTPTSGPVITVDYTLDHAHNRTSLNGMPYVLDTPGCGTSSGNLYLQTPSDTRAYDNNGNLVAISPGQPEEVLFEYDFANRMVARTESASGLRHEYTYDPFGRRITTIEDVTGASLVTKFFYQGRDVIEEQDAIGTTLATYVWAGEAGFLGAPGCRLLQLNRGGQSYVLHTDDIGSARAASDGSGVVVERYAYGDFGRPHFFDGNGQPLTQSAIGNPYLYAQNRFDVLSDFYYDASSTKSLDPVTGRYTSPIVVSAVPNPFVYRDNNPQTRWIPPDPDIALERFDPGGNGGKTGWIPPDPDLDLDRPDLGLSHPQDPDTFRPKPQRERERDTDPEDDDEPRRPGPKNKPPPPPSKTAEGTIWFP